MRRSNTFEAIRVNGSICEKFGRVGKPQYVWRVHQRMPSGRLTVYTKDGWAGGLFYTALECEDAAKWLHRTGGVYLSYLNYRYAKMRGASQ